MMGKAKQYAYEIRSHNQEAENDQEVETIKARLRVPLLPAKGHV